MAHFLADGYWRDLLSLSFDNRTLHTSPVIKDFLDQGNRLASAGLGGLNLEGAPTLVKANEGEFLSSLGVHLFMSRGQSTLGSNVSSHLKQELRGDGDCLGS